MFGFGPDMIFRIPALLIALTVHEYAHARTAVAFGDPTPRIAGRVTLNPIAHLDPIGLIMLLFAPFGWAKPVPVNPNNFRNGRKGDILVSFAGPGANMATAFITWLLYVVLLKMHLMNYEVAKVIVTTYSYNLGIAVFNLIPLPPLDGSHIVRNLLSGRQAYLYEQIAPYSNLILIGLFLSGFIGVLLYPFIYMLDAIIKAVVSLIY